MHEAEGSATSGARHSRRIDIIHMEVNGTNESATTAPIAVGAVDPPPLRTDSKNAARAPGVSHRATIKGKAGNANSAQRLARQRPETQRTQK